MAELSANQRSFIQMMKRSEEHARKGFELILARQEIETLFDPLASEGFFEASKNPAPVKVDETSVRIPYWAALDYLFACATLAGEHHNLEFAGKIMSILRAVTNAREEDGSIRHNHHTERRFAEIVGVLPFAAMTAGDMDLAKDWVTTPFNPGGVAQALDRHVLPRFLQSNDPENWRNALVLLRHCTAVRWETKGQLDTDSGDPQPVIEAYWMDEILKHHACALGRKLPAETAALLEARIREVFGKGGRAEWSYVFRPAVEAHRQNHSWHRPENSLVEALRDVILGWCEADTDAATTYVDLLLRSDVEMLRRIGIYVLGERWTQLQALYLPILQPQLFDTGKIHELSGLLERRFTDFTIEEKTATLDAIRHISAPAGEDAERRLKAIQLRWLSPISTRVDQDTAAWISQLKADTKLETLPHADFNTYSESFVGPGPTPYQVQELIAFAEGGEIVPRLNGFKPDNAWRGPTTQGLVEAIEQAVATAPASFLKGLSAFLAAAPPYQHGLIQGLKRLWDSGKEAPSFVWDETWPQLFTFFESLTSPDAFWRDEPGKEYTGAWIASAIADFVATGTRADDHVYPPSLVARAGALIGLLLNKNSSAKEASETDPMTQAINTAKGRAVEALFSHALRICRLADKESGSHAEAWAATLQPTFDAELQKCDHGNYEFSTLLGAYLANLDYMSHEWVAAAITRIFPANRPSNFACAVGGLAYSQPSRGIYVLLRDAGVMDNALKRPLPGRETRGKLVERIMLGYLWGEETLQSARLAYLFEKPLLEDLRDAASFFGIIRNPQLSNAQVVKIIDFWERCVDWAADQKDAPRELLATLSHLAWSLKDARGRNQKVLLAVAPHAQIGFGVYDLLEELLRLAEVSPAEVAAIFKVLVDASLPIYDYENRLKSLIKKLAQLDQKPIALNCCNRLISIPGMGQLFKELTVPVPEK